MPRAGIFELGLVTVIVAAGLGLTHLRSNYFIQCPKCGSRAMVHTPNNWHECLKCKHFVPLAVEGPPSPYLQKGN